MITELTYEEIKFLKDNNKDIKVQGPKNTWQPVEKVYTKTGPGYLIEYDDGTTNFVNFYHRILTENGWECVEDLEINTITKNVNYKNLKIIINKIPVKDQEWIDFSLDAINESYIQNGIIHHNTGKSLIVYALIKLFTDLDKKTLLIVPNTGLVEQMFSDFVEYGWDDIDDYVEILYSGKKPTYEKNVLISTWQSIPTKKKDPEFYQEYDCVFVDEVHNAKSFSLQKILKECTNAEYRIGTTATLPKDDSEKNNIFSVIGTPIFTYSTRDGIEDGFLSNMKIISMIMQYPKPFIEINKDRNYAMETKEIEEYAPRMNTFNIILNRITPSDNIIILCRHIAHLEAIKEHLLETTVRPIEIVHGGIKTKKREEIRKGINDREGVIILATYDTMATGVNINKIHHVIFGSPYKAKTKILQAIGRGLRLHITKELLLVWDMVDDMRRTKRTGKIATNYCWDHYEERMASYEEEGHEVVEEYIQI